MSGYRLPKKVLDAVWVLPDHVGVSVLPWQKYVSGLLQQYSVGSDDAFDDVEKCKSHVKKQIMLKYADMVVRDMPLLSSLHSGKWHLTDTGRCIADALQTLSTDVRQTFRRCASDVTPTSALDPRN
jgi:hypothetical protein